MVVGIKKFNATQVETEDQRWLKFFKDGERLNDEALPDWMITQEMKQAMSTLSTFSEKDQQYYQYQARQEYLREQRTIQSELELANKREALALHEKKVAEQEMKAAILREEETKEQVILALAEVERLKALLAQNEQSIWQLLQSLKTGFNILKWAAKQFCSFSQ